MNTIDFLQAAEGVVGLFNLLGGVSFKVVQADLNGNITKVRKRYEDAPTESETLQKLVLAERAANQKTATEGLMWLLRGLLFTCTSLQKSQVDKKKTLSTAFNEGYGETLKKFHGMLVKPVFTLAMSACPSRDVLLKSLTEDPNNKVDDAALAKTYPEVESKLDAWLAALRDVLDKLVLFYASLNDKNYKVL